MVSGPARYPIGTFRELFLTAKPISKIVIVGGGTAGWLTAGVIAARHRTRIGQDLSVTLVESPNTPIIGVGEGTWPTLRTTASRSTLRCSPSATPFPRPLPPPTPYRRISPCTPRCCGGTGSGSPPPYPAGSWRRR